MINNDGLIIKVFKPFEDVSKPSPSIDAMMISLDVFIREVVKQLWKAAG